MREPNRNSQAHDTLTRIQEGQYVPDAGAVGMTFEDGSTLAIGRHGWEVSTCVECCLCLAAPVTVEMVRHAIKQAIEKVALVFVPAVIVEEEDSVTGRIVVRYRHHYWSMYRFERNRVEEITTMLLGVLIGDDIAEANEYEAKGREVCR